MHGRKSFKEEITRGMAGFYLIPTDLHRTAVLSDKCNRKSHRYDFQTAMVEQFEMKHRKEKIILNKKPENALEDYIDALYLFETI